MTDNIPPEIRPLPSSALTGSRFVASESAAAASQRSKSLAAMMAGQSAAAPAPARISPEVRKLILELLEDAAANWVGGSTINEAIAFVEALP